MGTDRRGRQFRIGKAEIDIIVHGYPGKSVCHGGLGFSTIALLRIGSRRALVDVGSFGQRGLLLRQLKERGLSPRDITDVLLTHSHHDHSINWTLFNQANIVICQEELQWSLNQPWGETVVPELYVRELQTWPTLKTIKNGEEVFPNTTAFVAPGHTPGSTVFILDAGEVDVIFTGDACKNRAELMSCVADMSYDPAISGESIRAIRTLWGRKPGNILVPGHDLPMILEQGVPKYLGTGDAEIRAWFGEDLNETTIISLFPQGVGSTMQAAE